MLPSVESEHENRLLCVTSVASENPFMCLVTNRIPNYHLAGAGCGTQVLPFYIYDEDGSNRRENITDWALNEFRTHHSDPNLTKWDIFHYVYAVLHHPEYRERYAANLKRELPRIPFVGGRAGLQASVQAASPLLSTLPKASAQPLAAERLKETADPSTRAEALARDDNGKIVGGDRGPSTPAAEAAASAQDDSSRKAAVA